MQRSGSVSFSGEQVKYLMGKLDEEDPHKAIEIFIKIIEKEKIDPFKIHEYIKRLMEKDGF